MPDGTEAGTGAGVAQAAPAQIPAGAAGGDGPMPGEDWHNIRHRASEYENMLQEWTGAGYTADQLKQTIGELVKPAPAPGGAAGPAFGPDDMRRMMSEMFQKELMPRIGQTLQETLTTQQRQAQDNYQRQQAIAEAARIRDEGFNTALKSWGHADKKSDGSPNPIARLFRDHYQQVLWDIMDQRRPENLTDEQARSFYETPTTDDVNKTVQQMGGYVKNLKYGMAAAVAQEQAQQPGATLGSEPGGRQQKNWNEMSYEERRDSIVPPSSL